MRIIFAAVAILTAAVLVLAGCTRSTDGHAVSAPPAGTEPTFPTPRPTRTTPAPTTTPGTPTAPPDRPTAAPPQGDVLRPQDGYVFIVTKSGKTRCQLDTETVGCESAFTDPPEVDGVPANGVRVTADGTVEWVVGNLGAIPAVTLYYGSYSAVGWTIEAGSEGTRFTNDRTGHGMFVAVEGVQTF